MVISNVSSNLFTFNIYDRFMSSANLIPFRTIRNFIIAVSNGNLSLYVFIYNIFGNLSSSKEDKEVRNPMNEISIGNNKANIAVATSSPAEDFEFDLLPKVENADIITPSYSSGSVVKTTEDNYNIFNTLPDLV